MFTESQLSFISGDVHRGVVGIVSGMAGLSAEIKQAKKENHVRAAALHEQQSDPAIEGHAIAGTAELDGTAVTANDGHADILTNQTTISIHEMGTPMFAVESRASNPLSMPVIIPQ